MAEKKTTDQETENKKVTTDNNANTNDVNSKDLNSNTSPESSKKDEDMVSVPKNLLDSIVKKQEELEKTNATQAETLKKLEYAADRGRTAIYDQRNASGELIRTMTVGIWSEVDEKTTETKEYIIKGWKTIVDDVYIEDNGGVRRVVERQIIRLFLADENDEITERDVEYLNFYRKVQRRRAEVVGESKNENGEFRVLRFPDGREVEMEIRFINL